MTETNAQVDFGVQSEQPMMQTNSSQTKIIGQNNAGSMTDGVSNPRLNNSNSLHTQSRFSNQLMNNPRPIQDVSQNAIHPHNSNSQYHDNRIIPQTVQDNTIQYQPLNTISYDHNNIHMPQPIQDNTLQYQPVKAISHDHAITSIPQPIQGNTIQYQPANAITHQPLPALPPPSMQDNYQNDLRSQRTKAICNHSQPQNKYILGEQNLADGTLSIQNQSEAPSYRRQIANEAYEDKYQYICSLCNNYFKSERALRRHMDNIHEAYKQKEKGIKRAKTSACHLCFTDFHSERALIRHLKNIHDVVKFSGGENLEENKRNKRIKYELYN